mmetsp:Transcript_22056/g.30792  ORF Transcript_22056/g.30792 Transcript_22056/m.30792 type:complete len:172 (-) Transcript_22056:170-685(-)
MFLFPRHHPKAILTECSRNIRGYASVWQNVIRMDRERNFFQIFLMTTVQACSEIRFWKLNILERREMKNIFGNQISRVRKELQNHETVALMMWRSFTEKFFDREVPNSKGLQGAQPYSLYYNSLPNFGGREAPNIDNNFSREFMIHITRNICRVNFFLFKRTQQYWRKKLL